MTPATGARFGPLSQGGHDISEATIRQRYRRSVRNFFQRYRPLVTTWRVYDNTQAGLPQWVAHGDRTGQETVVAEATWRQMRET